MPLLAPKRSEAPPPGGMDGQPAAGFNACTARLLVAASKAAYVSPPDITGQKTNTQVLIHDAGTFLVIAFRGTQEPQDWLTDLEVRREPFWAGEVHAGFKAALYDVVDAIEAAIEAPYARPARPAVYVTGHSLGAALAMLAASLLDHRGYMVDSVYTFGQPRVGDACFCAAYDRELLDRTFRVVNEADIVPRVPGMVMGYRHAGQKIFLSPFMNKLELNPTFWALAAADSFDIFHDWIVGREIALLAEHHIDRYIERLSTL